MPEPFSPAEAAGVFARLAPMIAARRSMRLWSPTDSSYAARARPLTRRLPDTAAAVPLYVRGRTTLLALDFDVTHHGTAGVDRDVDRALAWIGECGGRAVHDHSTRGGRHILVPLPTGVALRKTDLEPLLRLLAARLPTLDITPMLNDRTGAITPPGSRCREGGFRRLHGSLDTAVDTFLTRSEPGLLARLTTALGGTHPPRTTGTPRAALARDTTQPQDTQPPDGVGDNARLRPCHRLTSPFPATVTTFARDGTIPDDRRWHTRAGRPDRSAARQSVLAAAALRGWSFTDITSRLPAARGDWAGFHAAYHRYGPHADAAIRRDWTTACRWAAANAAEFRPRAHKTQKTHRGEHPHATARATSPYARWLAATTLWVDAQWPETTRRATVHAVMQALAYAATLAHELVNDVPLVEFGGRSLSLMAGLMPETTLWQVLREVRDIPGAPILRTRVAAGQLADRYALVTPSLHSISIHPDTAHIDRVQVAPVHDAWSVLGLRCRRIHDLITHNAMTRPADIFTTARIGPSAGYDALAVLTTAGLVTHTRGRVTPGPTTLDDIAAAHNLNTERAQRITTHRQQRAQWRAWLTTRFALDHTTISDPTEQHPALLDPWDCTVTDQYLAAVLSTGPPAAIDPCLPD